MPSKRAFRLLGRPLPLAGANVHGVLKEFWDRARNQVFINHELLPGSPLSPWGDGTAVVWYTHMAHYISWALQPLGQYTGSPYSEVRYGSPVYTSDYMDPYWLVLQVPQGFQSSIYPPVPGPPLPFPTFLPSGIGTGGNFFGSPGVVQNSPWCNASCVVAMCEVV